MDEIDDAALIFGSKVSPILQRKLSEHGVSDPKDLPRETAVKILLEASTEAALQHFPHANVGKLQQGIHAFTNPRFSAALMRAEAIVTRSTDAFEMCVGPDAAVVLAGFGIKVAPFDRRKRSIIGDLTNNVDEVYERFANLKTAFVGYSPSDAEFYVLVTDSLSDLKSKLKSSRQLKPVADVVSRAGGELPTGTGGAFQHFGAVFARWPDDQLETLFLEDAHPDRGSVLFQAGWRERETRRGAPNDGFLPVPLALLRGALADPKLAFWLTEPKGQLTLH